MSYSAKHKTHVSGQAPLSKGKLSTPGQKEPRRRCTRCGGIWKPGHSCTP
jgi:hypothetical protein